MPDQDSRETHRTENAAGGLSGALVADAGLTQAPSPWRELAWLFIVNCLITATLMLGYVVGIPTGLRGAALYALPFAMLGQAAFLNMAPALPAALLFFRRKPGLATRVLAGLPFILLQLWLFSDVMIYRLFRRHFDGLVWNILTTKGAGDSMKAGVGTVLTFAIIILVLITFIWWLSTNLPHRLSRFRPRLVLILLLAFIAVERTTYAIVDLHDNSAVNCLREVLPLYQPLTVKKGAKFFGYKRRPALQVTLPAESGFVELPKRPLVAGADLRKPNIVIIIVDGGRSDVLNETVMPRLEALAKESFRLENHFSTGNETRVGILGLLYGIPGTYWPRVLAQRISSPWLDFLADHGYEFRILSCTDLNFPEFRQTAFVKLTGSIQDQWDCPRVERDRRMTDAFVTYLRERTSRGAGPFFAFLFYDASHQPYNAPPEHALFERTGAQDDINYAAMALSPSAGRQLKNRYFNTLHYVDEQIGRIADALRDAGEYHGTILVVVGDHGEEFGEQGNFGHTSSFNRFQTQTLGVLKFPDMAPRTVEALTDHADIMPSVLTWMGVSNELSDYTTGLPIQALQKREFLLLAGWQSAAILKPDSITVFKGPQVSSYDSGYRPIPDKDARRPSGNDLLQALNQMRIYLK